MAVIFQHRFGEAIQRLRRAIQHGKLRKLILVEASIKWHRSQEYYNADSWRGTWQWDAGGALINQSIHTIDLLQWMMGLVEAFYEKIGPFTHQIETESLGVALLTFKTGALGVIEGSTSIFPGSPERLEIHSDKGSVVLEGGKIKTWEIEGEKDIQDIEPIKWDF